MKLTLLLTLFAGISFAQSQSTTQTTITRTTVSEESQQPGETFDVKYKDDRGKLVVAQNEVRFEDVSNASRSKTWTYAQIKEFRRSGGKELKIEPYKGDSHEFHIEGKDLTDDIYKTISDRIVAARAH